MNNHLQSRQNVIKGIFLTVVLILISKLFYIQIINSQYKRSAKNNAIRLEVQQAARGEIRDRNGKLMVSIQPSYDLMVIPKNSIDEKEKLGLKNLGIQTFSIYALTLIFIHNSFLFLLEKFSFSLILPLILKVVLSTIVTFIIILIFQLFTFKTKE